MLIKVCGISSSRHLAEIESLDIDMTGVIRYDLSPRYTNEIPVKKTVPQVAVYVNESIAKIHEDIQTYNFDLIQLHGSESPEMIKEFASPEILIKAVSVASVADIETARKYAPLVKYILLDTKSPKYGGTGKKFDWEILKHCDFPFILSGGIGPEDAEQVINLYKENPHFLGIDLNSRFELKPGIKNIIKLEKFITHVRNETR